MSASQAGAKSVRRQKHLQRQRELKERKALRKKRAAIHGAMGEAIQIRKTRKKGYGDFNAIMAKLGYVARDGYEYEPHNGYVVTLSDVTDKYEAMS